MADREFFHKGDVSGTIDEGTVGMLYGTFADDVDRLTEGALDDFDGTIDKDKVGLLNGTCAGDIDRLTTYAAWYMCCRRRWADRGYL